jgi:tRNA(fMet)-specific endonuclease VapC
VGLLIDSTLLIRAEREALTPEQLLGEIVDRWGDTELAISAMSAGELFHGCWRADTPARRASREEFVETLLSAIPVVPLGLSIMRIFGEIDARLRAKGKTLPTSDLLVGCTALSRRDEIVTGNVRHFRGIPGLKVRGWR